MKDLNSPERLQGNAAVTDCRYDAVFKEKLKFPGYIRKIA